MTHPNKGHHETMNGLPPFLPHDLASRLHWLTPDPEYWFTGQFVAYLLRPKQELNLDFKNLAVHVRRGDKIQEAYFYDVEKYMDVIQDYVQIKSHVGQKVEKIVYVSTDDPNALKDIREKYQDFKVIGNASVAEEASSVLTR